MLSIIVYGRNDENGYNYHKRVALSLNGFAALLDSAGDEILFCDYNSDDSGPTLPEAIADTLTDEAKARMRVFRVRGRDHATTGASQPLVESIARNVALRRSNPSNRWVLSTNTDVIPLVENARGLGAVLGELADGQYGAPRIELPESVWDRLDRSQPRASSAAIRSRAGELALVERMRGVDAVLFDNPGDFQLFLREDLLAADGFDERMLQSWHVDHNIALRIGVRRGPPRSLESMFAAYHCSHHRLFTRIQSDATGANDADVFVQGDIHAGLPAQRHRWGLADAPIEEVRLRPIDPALSDESTFVSPRTAFYTPVSFNGFAYEAAHVLPHLADLLRNRDRRTVIAYAGVRADMARATAAMIARCGFERPLAMLASHPLDAATDDPAPIDAVDEKRFLRDSDLFIFEFGALRDGSGSYRALDATIDLDHREIAALDAVYRLLERVASAETATATGPSRIVVIINAVHNIYQPAVERLLALVKAPFTTRLRHGLVRNGLPQVPPRLPAELAALLGRPAPVSLAELVDLSAVTDPVSGKVQDASDATARVNARALAALAGLSDGAGFADLADASSDADPVNRAAPLPARRRSAPTVTTARPAPPLSGLASTDDWDDPAWLACAVLLAKDAVPERANARDAWVWERAHSLYALSQGVGAGSAARILVAAEMQDDLIAKIGTQASVDVLDIRTAWRPETPRHLRYFTGRGENGNSALDADALLPGHYDAVVMPHACAFAEGPEGFATLLARLEPALRDGGIVVIAASLALGPGRRDDGLDLGIASADGVLGQTVAATGFAYAGDVRLSLSEHERALASMPDYDVPGALASPGEGGPRWPAVFVLRKDAATAADAWSRLQDALGDRHLGPVTAKLRLSPGSSRTAKGIIAAPRNDRQTVFFGPYLDLKPGAYEMTARVRIPASGRFSAVIEGFIEIVAGDERLAEITTDARAFLVGHTQRIALAFDIADAPGRAPVEIRAVLAADVPVVYRDIVVRRRRG